MHEISEQMTKISLNSIELGPESRDLSSDAKKKPLKRLKTKSKIKSTSKGHLITLNTANHLRNCLRLDQLPRDVIACCFKFLLPSEILAQQRLSKCFYDFIIEYPAVFQQCRELQLNVNWASIPIRRRQYFLCQMQNLEYLYVNANSFMENGIIIQEVAALVYRNKNTLQTIKLFSPDNPLLDDTPKHQPFCFTPAEFPKLRNLHICGCQALEWSHIFGNCCTPLVSKFEISHFSLQADHWSWNVLYDFTSIGVAGLHRLLDTMGYLERLTVGLDVWFDSLSDPPPEQARTTRVNSRINSHVGNISYGQLDNNYSTGSYSTQMRGLSIQNSGAARLEGSNLIAIENSWRDRGLLRSYKGKLSEEDFGDIFAISFVRAGRTGSLKRVILKFRFNDENEVEDEEGLNPITEFFRGTSSFCQRALSNIFTHLIQSTD